MHDQQNIKFRNVYRTVSYSGRNTNVTILISMFLSKHSLNGDCLVTRYKDKLNVVTSSTPSRSSPLPLHFGGLRLESELADGFS